MNIKEQAEEIWNDPKKRNYVLLIAMLPVAYLLYKAMFAQATPPPAVVTDDTTQITNLIGTGSIDKLESNQIAEFLQEYEDNMRRREAILAKKEKDQVAKHNALREELETTQSSLRQLQQTFTTALQNINTGQNGHGRRIVGRNGGQQEMSTGDNGRTINRYPAASNPPNDFNERTKSPSPYVSFYRGANGEQHAEGFPKPAIRTITPHTVRTVNADGDVEEKPAPNSVASRAAIRQENANVMRDYEALPEEEENETGFLPVGSIITGVLINGVDAPTSGKAGDVPFLLRVKHEAQLPNYFTTDIRECFIVASGQGNLATSRADVRTNTISCVNEDGEAIEASLKAYAVSSKDGKAGIPGRLVTKSGQVIARAMMSGFMSGISDAAAPQAVNIISDNTDDGWQSPDWGKLGSSSVFNGASNALDTVAEYYISLAEEMHPVIEIGAMNEVNFIVTNGATLKFSN
ncbi:hypothetical protein IC617_08220 [Neiella sp. HB171785]|uniref:Conjugal transfer protein TraB n=1 Tax=Neiella litorisoli TaxID=2771431 RepID=A0A8J6QGC5_9GAMM|nr:TrbI/VirB10 family protein [Neiella litorisoli]MBD1389409.1 hypothetical protein [Neiella litorisoli]